jgi:hypothetical protein
MQSGCRKKGSFILREVRGGRVGESGGGVACWQRLAWQTNTGIHTRDGYGSEQGYAGYASELKRVPRLQRLHPEKQGGRYLSGARGLRSLGKVVRCFHPARVG